LKKYVYSFNEGNKDMRNILGGKGANLAEMTNIGLPVPKGFTISTEACTKYYQSSRTISTEIKEQIFNKLEELELKTNKNLGGDINPLLISVRSGARASMPGMLDTILNLGLNDKVALTLTNLTNNKRFVYDSYRRLIMMFADVVKEVSKDKFESVLEQYKHEKGVTYDTELDGEDMYYITEKFKEIYQENLNEEFPQEPRVQLIEAVTAVFRSWNNERAIIYREMNNIPASWGTAVNVQEMVYGNMGDNSGTGVAFTRNPSTGENKFYGEYLINAQGEDVVAGIRTPESIETLQNKMPEVYEEFLKVAKLLEEHYLDMQDMEFTIENGKLYMLQTRNGKRTTAAALKIAVDLVKENKITKEEALLRIEPKTLDQLLHKNFEPTALKNAKEIAKGLAASPGAATGEIYFTAEEVSKQKENGKDTILVRTETSPEDIKGMNDANGILTIRGGMTSHAAVVARGMGRCCVCGCENLTINEEELTLTTKDGKVYHEGDIISLDGSTGLVYDGVIETVEPTISGDFETFMNWANEIKKLGVKANADNPKDAEQAIKFGAEGIGLCRTEHMFFEKERIFAVRQMIVSETKEQRIAALNKILPMQKEDFIGMFKVLEGKTMIIRYLDPPLHEFLPKTELEIKELATELNMTYDNLKTRIESLKEFNPMMGHRGCRLAITYPEIAEMQTRAVIEAAIEVQNAGIPVSPEIMIPLIGEVKEFEYIKDIVDKTAKQIMEETQVEVEYKVGTMIEVPRAALLSSEIAKRADFYSFGTNDLTQMTYGFSRDDASKYLKDYYDKQIFETDPFESIDPYGVGKLIKTAVSEGRSVKSAISMGICGEHGGDPESIDFCHKVGLDYVSCSPYRVPIAKLAAAQAAINNGDK